MRIIWSKSSGMSTDTFKPPGEDGVAFPVVVNGSGDEIKDELAMDTQCSNKKHSVSTSSSLSPVTTCSESVVNKTGISPSDEGVDTNLDDRLLSALNDLDFPGNKCSRTSNFSKSKTASCVPQDCSGSEDSDSDTEEESCPNAMGYMPLPQEPDVDLCAHGVSVRAQEQDIVGQVCSHCDGVKKKGATEDVKENIPKGASVNMSPQLKEGTYAM